MTPSARSLLARLRATLIAGVAGLVPLAAVVGALAYHPFWPAPTTQLPANLPRQFTWGISWHPDTIKDSHLPADFQMAAVQDLGVGLVRFDVRWGDLQTTEAPLDESSLPFFRKMVEATRSRGLAVKVNLGSYPAWAIALMKRDPEAFFRSYRIYVRTVVEAMGDGVSYYQLGNEFNTVLDPIPAELDARVFREARAEIDRVKAERPGWKVKTVINVCDTFYLPWHGALEQVMREASSAIDVVGYDFYGGNYSHLNDWSAWPGIDYISDVMRRYDKEGAVCEMGCFTVFGEERQARWLSEASRAMLRAMARSPMRDRFLFAAFYELTDAPTVPTPLFITEKTWGLMDVHGRHKPGYAVFKDVVAQTRVALAKQHQEATRP